MKPRQRRGESFNISKSSSNRAPETRNAPDPSWRRQPENEVPNTRGKYDSQEIYNSAKRRYSEAPRSSNSAQGFVRSGNLSSAKSTPSLNQADDREAYPSSSGNWQQAKISPARSSPNIKEELNKERQYGQPNRRRPPMLDMKSVGKTASDYPSPQKPWSYQMDYGSESGRNYMEKPNPNMYTNEDIYNVDSKSRKYERRSLPPHILRYQADYENISALGTTPLQSEKISEIEDESDVDAPEIPPRPPSDLIGPPSSPPAPPIRDPSSLRYVRNMQNHEKYPSWPVTKPSGNGEQAQPITTRAQSWTDHTNTSKELPGKPRLAQPTGLRPVLEKNSPQSERKIEDGSKSTRIGSDPGLKTPEFVYDKLGRVKRRNYENVGGKNKFEDFIKYKPGYPPPMLDSDGHNYGDKEYNVPSPPERDMPGINTLELSDKLVTSSVSVSENSAPVYTSQYNENSRKSVDSSKFLDSGTSPMQSPVEDIRPSFSKIEAKRKDRSAWERLVVDSSTSPLQSPQESKDSSSFDGVKNSVMQNSPQNRPQPKAVIVKQTPYYNTSTQTEVSSYAIKTSLRSSGPKQCNAEVQVNNFAGQTSPVIPADKGKELEEKSFQPRTSVGQSSANVGQEKSSVSDASKGSVFRFSGIGNRNSQKPVFEGIQSIQQKYATDDEPEEICGHKNSESSIPKFTDTNSSTASILRKLSEEFYRGKIPHYSEKRYSSASSQDAHPGGLKEAESYSSVVIHPSESSGPFGRDYFGSRSSLSDSRGDVSSTISESVASSRGSTSRGRYSLDPSVLSHQNRSDSRYSSSSSTSHARGNSLSHLDRDASRRGQSFESLSSDGRQRSSSCRSSDSSTPSQPKSSTDTRTSGSTQYDDSPPGHHLPLKGARDSRSDSYNDSVFASDERSPLPREGDKVLKSLNSEDSKSVNVSVGRKPSMKKAYGVFDENDEAEGSVRGNKQDVDNQQYKKGMQSSLDYVQMHQIPPQRALRVDSTHLDQIQEVNEGDGNSVKDNHTQRLASADIKVDGRGKVEEKYQKSSDWRTTRDMWKEEYTSKRTNNLKRTSSEQIPQVHDRSERNSYKENVKNRDNIKVDNYMEVGSGASRSSKLDSRESLGAGHIWSSESDLKKHQKQALVNFVKREKGKRSSSGSNTSQDDGHSLDSGGTNTYEQIGERSPVQSVKDIITKASENLNASKAHRADSLRRSGSSASSRNSSDYVEMGRQDRPDRQRKETEWSRLRSQGSFSYSPDLSERKSNRNSTCSENPYEDISVFSPSTPRNSLTEKPREHQDERELSNRDPLTGRHHQLSGSSSMDSGLMSSPTYQNLFAARRRPPPPPPRSPSPEEKPPALPPRNYRRASANQPAPQVRSEGNVVDDTKMEFKSLLNQWENSNSPREDAYADQLRIQARRYSEQQRPNPIPMSIIQSRTQINFSASFKCEPMLAQEATPPGASPSSSMDQSETPSLNDVKLNVVSENNKENTAPSSGKPQLADLETSGQRERTLSDIPLPSPPQNFGEELKLDDSELPPPPLDLIEDSEKSQQGREETDEFADDSYGAHKSRSRREVGKYSRSVSAAAVKTENNNYKSSIDASAQFGDKRLGHNSWNSDSALQHHGPAAGGQNPSRDGANASVGPGGVPAFKAESARVKTGIKSVVQPLPSVAKSSVYSPRPFVSNRPKSREIDNSQNRNIRPVSTGSSSVKDRLQIFESRDSNEADIPGSSEPVRTSSPKHSAGCLSSESSWKTQENLSFSGPVSGSMSQRIVDSWEEEKARQKDKSSVLSSAERKRRSGDFSMGSATSSNQRYFDNKSAAEQSSSDHTQRVPEQRLKDQSRTHDPDYTRTYSSDRASNDSVMQWLQEPSKLKRVPDNSGNQKVPEAFVNQRVPEQFRRSCRPDNSGGHVSPEHPEHSRTYRSSEHSGNQRVSDQCGNQTDQKNVRVQRVPDHHDNHTVPDNTGLQRVSQQPDSQTGLTYPKSQRDLENVGIQKAQEQTQGQKLVDTPSHTDSPGHGRQPSQEEIECDQQAKQLAQELEEKDKKLSDVLKQDSNKKRMQYLDGIFTEPDVSRKPHDMRKLPKGDNSSTAKKESLESEKRGALPATYFKSPRKAIVEMELRMNEEAGKDLIKDIQDNDALKKQKEELMEKLYVKLDILREEKLSLEQEISENEALGARVRDMVEKKCRSQSEKAKFHSYIDDLEKIVRLMLNLSGQLARAENAIQSLSQNADARIKKMTLDKRERLQAKYEDARKLKEDIDQRSDHVSASLRDSLLEEEFQDYSYFIKMKSKLTIEFQELEDKITLGEEQIQELRKSIPDK